MDSPYFSGRIVKAKEIVFRNLDPVCGPVAAKPLVLEILCLEVGTSVASALTAETGYESMKCMCDVDMRGRVRMGQNRKFSYVFQLWLRPR